MFLQIGGICWIIFGGIAAAVSSFYADEDNKKSKFQS